MAYIAPNSTIHILKNVPLDMTYNNTLYFGGTTSQYNYFFTKTKYSFGEQSYQRVNQNSLRIQIPADSLYDCNYLMFQNTSYSGKWFYAFLTDVRYINNAVSEVDYTIDVMQTWLPGIDYATNQWFVEREHSVNDAYFENTQPEPVELGTDTVVLDYPEISLGDLGVCCISTVDETGEKPSPTTHNNIYNCVKIIAGETYAVSEDIETLIFNGYEDGILAMYMFPTILFPSNYTENGHMMTKLEYQFAWTPLQFSGYTPKNNKLYTHPYYFLSISNNAGETVDLKYENFYDDGDHEYKFGLNGCYYPSCQLMFYPKNYLNKPENFDFGNVMANFPTCAFSGDTFRAWWAQNKGSVISSGISSTVSSLFHGGVSFSGTESRNNSVGQFFSGGDTSNFGSKMHSVGQRARISVGVDAVGGATTAFSNVLNTIGKSRDLMNTPPTVHGQLASEVLQAATKRYKYTIYRKGIKREYAEIIDNFFNMFGYATNKIKAPNINSRPHWNYVKTSNAYVIGDMPQEASTSIANIFNKGITFWKNGAEVGLYSLDNRPNA